ncbi:hypothetical protein Acr_00g0070820 [Actinidia rufa]|uniref:Uncharacterized protein n=1 Tax=Actinidia rufa TaxID=165716 RepID=A0A7J0DSQ7_9ERIC|nr:hypothetical protein Acr_00g0070820 [Actinidia rufa]
MTGSSPQEYQGTPVFQRSRGHGALQISLRPLVKRCNKTPILSSTEQKRIDDILASLGGETPLRSRKFSSLSPSEVASGPPLKQWCLVNLAKMVKSSKVATLKSSTATMPVAKGVVIHEKHPRDEGMIPPLDKEEVEKLDLDLEILKLFNGVGQAIEELKKMKEDRDATIQKLEKENAELKAKEVECLHLELDLQDMQINDELAWKQEEGEEEEEEEQEKDGGKGDISPISL